MEGLRQRVRELVLLSGRSQREFAETMGLEPSKLSKSLKGIRRFSAEELIRLADTADVTVNWLLNGRDDAATVVAIPPGQQSPGPDGTAVPAPRSGSGDRRRQIIEAAWQLIAANGYHSVRTADIARACGTSSATIHYHFPTLRDLLDEALRTSAKQAFDRQVAVLHTIPDARERLDRLIELQLPNPGHLTLEWSIWMQVWTESTLHPHLRELHAGYYQRWHDTIAQTLRDGVAQGVFGDIDTEAATMHLTALIDGLAIQVLTRRPGRTVQRMRDTLREFVSTRIEGVTNQ
ncbi:TetR family transcriptional regulator C-terminal domain-containing protein [Streptomonospora wellingtoniae]|uniref:TetR family transcriptional regulator C-terminal domain-containing protein n=1 Tax=Streptomonospora wellingtoniae TaxID=3075544 RepID=A0ABU2KRZ0_9ACTN|nr:TetR family transcriptional regulator C-terminal domain-containing protein [Streptomonospora sp. DSM 45055]MDT0302056.1 TetR family transcriptional regulator C-terminal domain-containing protein [Streptomonospora sp. DSM 45055]